MVTFVLLASLLAGAILFALLRPLWRDARRAALGIAVAIPLATIALYRIVGTPAALDPKAVAAPTTLADAIGQLEAQLERDPRQPEGWRLLGRAYTTEQRFDRARDAFARAAELSPRDPDVLVEAAQGRALAAPQRRFDAAAVALLERALQANAGHQRARWFLGVAQRQAGRHAVAAATWEALLKQVDAPTAASLRPQIDAARAAAGLAPLPAATPAAGAALQVAVALDPELAARVRLDPRASVFVIARAPDGPPMPVAVEKRTVGELPLVASLDDGDSLMPTLKLSALEEVELVARVSASGDATPRAGDLESRPVRVRLPAAATVELRIGTTRQ